MNRLLDESQKKEHHAGGEGPVSMSEERTQKTHGRENGEDGDLRIMQHFVRDFIERPDDIDPLW